MKWTDLVRFQDFGEEIIIANQMNKRSYKISKECLDYIDQGIAERLTQEELIASFEEEEDKDYISQLLERLYELYMLVDSDFIFDGSYLNFSWNITYDCNLRCKHCSVSAGENLIAPLPYESMIAIADKIIGLNPKSICISGGEALVYDRFKDLVTYMKANYSGHFKLMTNGTLIDEEMAIFIAKTFATVDISLDGYDEESCASIRGKGVFDKVINAIYLLHKNSFDKICLSMVMTKELEHHRGDFVDLCKSLKVASAIRTFSSTGRGKENQEELKIKKEYHQIETQEESGDLTQIEYDLGQEIEPETKKDRACIEPNTFACKAAISEFLFDPQGDIYPCPALSDEEFNMGNLLEIEDFFEYLKNKEYEESQGYRNFSSYLPYHHKPCATCKYNMCCFNCVAEIKDLIDTGAFEEKCKLNKYSNQIYMG